MVKLDILGLSTGRSGSKSFAKYLNDNGIKCAHEDIFGCTRHTLPDYKKAVNASKQYDAESSWLSLPFLEQNLLEAAKYVFLIRNPFLIIDSYEKLNLFISGHINDPYVKFCTLNNPKLRLNEYPSIINSAIHVTEWIFRIEKALLGKNHIIYRIDIDSTDKLNTYLNTKGGAFPITNRKLDKKTKKGISSKNDATLMNNVELYNKILRICEKYGYK